MQQGRLVWLGFWVKTFVSALLFVFAGVGVLLVLERQWMSELVLNQLRISWQHDPMVFLAVAIAVCAMWLLTVREFYSQVLLVKLAEEVQNLEVQARETKSTGLDLGKYGWRLRPLTSAINGVFDSAQTAMIEERAIERSKDEMITNVSHDLRTPLTSILGYLGLIENDVDDKLSKSEMAKYADIAYNKAGQMKSLVEDLFDYTQVRQVDFQLHWAPLDLAAMLQQLAVNYELEAKNRGLVISAITKPATIEMVGDPDRLARVFMNLISNALKYGEGATFIRLAARIVDEGKVVEVRVTNNGEAIPTESVERLFDRFYRVERSRNTKTGGTGLGLAIVSSVIEAHGGSVRVESDSELTSFIIRLPLQDQNEIV
ncbi:two-component histidine kinase [Weissella oryzae SG25]|uniref:histidine kinase n=1 Tax=Weissella oryzae (strain DSM 25784 / JCM 18191 / LMG 30913 / SG25) TaxID=1329250 RepID=A0A069CRS2_WEIOS|nr:HAMP domain-containing sensor histidine kinase [Weissella oryzae]GAK30077.1 two-component histidine kinase [Weissella oryzae SG25]